MTYDGVAGLYGLLSNEIMSGCAGHVRIRVEAVFTYGLAAGAARICSY